MLNINKSEKDSGLILTARNGEYVLGNLVAEEYGGDLLIKNLYCEAIVRGGFVEGELLDTAEAYAAENSYSCIRHTLYEPHTGNGYLEFFRNRGYTCQKDKLTEYLYIFTPDDIILNSFTKRLRDMPLITERFSAVGFNELNARQKAQFESIDIKHCQLFKGFDEHLTTALVETGSKKVAGKHYASKAGNTIRVGRMFILPEYRRSHAGTMMIGRFLRLFLTEQKSCRARYRSPSDGRMVGILNANLCTSAYTVYDIYNIFKPLVPL